MNQNVLEHDSSSEPGGSLVRWAIVIIIILLVSGAGYWYYSVYIVGGKGRVSPSPSLEVTEAPWKTKSEKTTTDFLDFWLKSDNTTEGIVQAKKARDLLTISGQARLETTKDAEGNPIEIIASQLDVFVDVQERPSGYEIMATKQIDERTVETRVTFNYNQTNTFKDKVFTLTSESSAGSIWLIDAVKEYTGVATPAMASPSPSPSPSPSL